MNLGWTSEYNSKWNFESGSKWISEHNSTWSSELHSEWNSEFSPEQKPELNQDLEIGVDKLRKPNKVHGWPSRISPGPGIANDVPIRGEINGQTLPVNTDLVYVYLFPAFNTTVLDPFVMVTERDETNHMAVARVTPASLEELILMEEVRGVRTVSPPLVRKISQDAGSYSAPCLEKFQNLQSFQNFHSFQNFYSFQNFLSFQNFHSFQVIKKYHKVQDFHKLHEVSEKGVRVGIVSDGVDSLAGAQAAGALPEDIYVLARGSGDEGTSMLEIVHDIAPDAELYFHEAGSNKLEFNRAVDALLAEGCKIICDDIGWPDEPFFEDGIVASHIRESLENNDLVYISAAGNDAKRHYQGMFFDDGSGWHDFSSGKSSSKNLYVDIPEGGELTIVLQWNDPWGASENDYDLYLKDCSSGEELASSKNSQDGKGVPMEFFRYANPEKKTLKGMVCIEKYSGEPGVLEVYIYPESCRDIYPDNLVEEDSVFGHPAVPGVLCIGAVCSKDKNSENERPCIAPYSSRGPVSIYFPQYEAREKPDLCGPAFVKVKGIDGNCKLFAGTSASAPYVAGVAALVWSDQPEKNASEIREILCATAGDLGAPGYDSIFGYGFINSSAFMKGQ